jgi:hypothetical protein
VRRSNEREEWLRQRLQFELVRVHALLHGSLEQIAVRARLAECAAATIIRIMSATTLAQSVAKQSPHGWAEEREVRWNSFDSDGEVDVE